MDEQTYIKERLNEQIEWYDSKSKDSQKKFKLSKYFVISASAIIPFLVNLNIESIFIRVVVSALGIVITISESIVSLNKYNENWIEYRTVCETLKHEKYMYLNGSGVYSDEENRFNFFVERIESIISQENVNWASLNKEKKK